ncbi:MAG: hypothetical protein COA78_01360 [Blastopirellula sp.]|nr:MAG: hypothetical protein COA78_01360 [Blastopirellula sp.]
MPAASDNGPQPSIVRGFLYAIPIAGVGFVIPFALFITIEKIRHYMAYSRLELDLGIDSRYLDWKFLWPGIGCSFVFGLAAFLNYAPANCIGLIRAIIFVGAAILLGAATSGLVELVFDLSPNVYRPEPWQISHLIIAFCVPLIYTITHTAIRFHSKPLPNSPTTSPLKDKTP